MKETTRKAMQERIEEFEAIPNYDALLRSSELEVVDKYIAGAKRISLSCMSEQPSKLRTMLVLLICESIAPTFEVAEYEKLVTYKKAVNELNTLKAKAENSLEAGATSLVEVVKATNKAEKAEKAYTTAYNENCEVKNILARYSSVLATIKTMREEFVENETKVFNFLYNFVVGDYSFITGFEKLAKDCNEYARADEGKQTKYTKHCYMTCKNSVQEVLVDGFKITDSDESAVFKSHVSNFNGAEVHNIIKLLSAPAINEVLASDGFHTFTLGHMAVEIFTEVVNKLIIGKFAGIKFVYEKSKEQEEFESQEEQTTTR